MIAFNADIVSFVAAANIKIGSNINDYIEEINNAFNLKKFSYDVPGIDKRNAYVLNGTVTITTLSDGLIISVGVNEKYKGKYKDTIEAGQKWKEIKKLTEFQKICNGCVIVDNDFGVAFELPSPYDEIADEVDHIPDDVVFNSIRIADYQEWR